MGKIYSVPILQSNYYLDKAENTITATEELHAGARLYHGKMGYGSQNRVTEERGPDEKGGRHRIGS